MLRSSILALAVRLALALATQTFFQPDEYFQACEVAHRSVFGYGQLTWEWLSPNPIRSILYPALNVPVYWTLKHLHLDHTKLLIWGPKVVHGVFAAATDIWLRDLTRSIVGERYVSTAFYLSLTSFFHGLSLSRSMSNSLETSVTTIALSYFPWDYARPARRNDVRKMCLFAALACAVRPTNAVIWIYVFAVLLFRLRSQQRSVTLLVLDAFITGSVALSIIFVLDSAYYGSATFTPFNFLRTNLSSVSLFYGIGSWHYYFSQAIPILCATTLPFVIDGARLAIKSPSSASRTILGVLIWTLAIYSLAGHKEWRFLHPLLPLMHVLAAKSLVDRNDKLKKDSDRKYVFIPIRWRHLGLVSLTIPAIAYVSRFHGRSQIDVMYYLRTLPSAQAQSIGFLMPCHSTPWQAYLHRPELADAGRLWALGCEPPLMGEDVGTYKDQTDIFYESPATYLRSRFPRIVDPSFPPSLYPCTLPGSPSILDQEWQHEWPQNIVLFGALLDELDVRQILERNRYREVWKSEWGWEGDARRRGGVRVWRHSLSG